MNTEDMKVKLLELVELKGDYEAKQKTSGDAHKLYKIKEFEVLTMLDEADLKSYDLPDVCKVSMKSKMSVTTPKTPESKGLLFKWLKDNLGSDGFLAYASVNSASLNSLYNEHYEIAEDKATFEIAGVDAPTEMKSLSVRRK